MRVSMPDDVGSEDGVMAAIGINTRKVARKVR